jgi:hypothetical protein
MYGGCKTLLHKHSLKMYQLVTPFYFCMVISKETCYLETQKKYPDPIYFSPPCIQIEVRI